MAQAREIDMGGWRQARSRARSSDRGLPDIVQLGGIYTPPALRGRGYAKVAVAGALQAARARGA